MSWVDNIVTVLKTRTPACPFCGEILEYVKRDMIAHHVELTDEIFWDDPTRKFDLCSNLSVVYADDFESPIVYCPHCGEQLPRKFVSNKVNLEDNGRLG